MLINELLKDENISIKLKTLDKDLTSLDVYINKTNTKELVIALIEIIAKKERETDYLQECIDDCDTIDIPVIENMAQLCNYEELIKELKLPIVTALYNPNYSIDPINLV